MKTVQNEKGYTLLLTLLIIFIIIIFFSSFSLSAMNQQKQVEKTDENYEVTAIAEMGVEYYRASILNLIAEYQNPSEGKGRDITQATVNDLNNYIKENEDNIKNGKKPSDYDETIKRFIAFPISKLKKDIGELFKKDAVTVSNNSFKITKDLSNDDGSWTVEVTGYSEGKQKTLSATFKLPTDFKLISTTLTSGNPVGGSFNFSPLVIVPTFPEVNPLYIVDANNQPLSECGVSIQNKTCKDNSFNNLGNLLNSKIYTDGSKNLEGTRKDAEKSFPISSKVYINGNLNVNYLNQQFKQLSLYASGTITMPSMDGRGMLLQSKESIYLDGINDTDKSLDYLNDGLYIYTPKMVTFKNSFSAKFLTLAADSAEFKNLNTFENSTIEIRNKENKMITTTFPVISSFNKSSIQINNSVIFNNINNGINNSNINVNGNATFGKFNLATSNVHITGNLITSSDDNINISGDNGNSNRYVVLVNNIEFTNSNFISNSKKVNLSGTVNFCIRNKENLEISKMISTLKNLDAKGQSRVIVYDKSLDNNTNTEIAEKINDDSYFNGVHFQRVSLSFFNKECGTTSVPETTPITNTYVVNSNTINENEITSEIIYK